MNADRPTDARPILVFATHNPNKVRELQEMLGDRYQIQSLTDIGCHEEIVEDAPTLEGNAQIKARHVPTTPASKSMHSMALPGCTARVIQAAMAMPRAT